MLVLSRKEGERLVIGERIVITVVELDGGRVRIGVEAPRDINIRREELAPRPVAAAINCHFPGAGESPLFAECR